MKIARLASGVGSAEFLGLPVSAMVLGVGLLTASAFAADLEVGVGAQLRPVPVQQFPYQQPMYGKILRYTRSQQSDDATRAAIAAHASRPVLVLVRPDNTPADTPLRDFRCIWLANLLHSKNDDVQRILSESEVIVAPTSLLRQILAEVRDDALMFAIASRDGKPFAWTLATHAATDDGFITAFREGILTGKDAQARMAQAQGGLDEALRKELEPLVKDLGHDEYQRREAATERLAQHMPKIAGWLQSLVATTKDPEVKARLNFLLAGTGRGWQQKNPIGATWTDVRNSDLELDVGRFKGREGGPKMLPVEVQVDPRRASP